MITPAVLAVSVLALVVVPVPGDPGVPPSSASPPAPSAASQRAASARAVPLIAGGGAVVRVTDAASLTSALAAVLPGQTIELADGRYRGPFTIERPGAPGAPITLRGSGKAVLDGGAPNTPGAVVRLNGASHWQLVGFAVTGAHGGIALVRTEHTILSGLDVGHSAGDGIHVAGHSTRNVVQNCLIHDSGAGLRVGSAAAGPPGTSSGQPDRSDGTKVINNTVRRTIGPNVEVHEFTEGGLIVGNLFDGSRISRSGAVVLELKGVGYRILDNVTVGVPASLAAGFRTRVVGDDPVNSGCGNTLHSNVFAITTVPTIVLDPRCPARK